MKRKIEIRYTEKDGYLYPDLTIGEMPREPLRRYGRLRKHFLKEHRSGLYQGMLLCGQLAEHLQEVDRSAEEMMDSLMTRMAEKEKVTESLKAADQMGWVRKMESIRSRAEEIVLSELVYN